MSNDPSDPLQAEPRQRAVPSGRAARFGQFGRLAAGVGGGMIAEGARRLAAGERPRMSDLLLTPGNFGRLADRLSHLRGAAMKLGQMISMDSGDFLPEELSQVLARLRDNAHHMPPQQLQQVLAAQWGKDWRTRFQRFEPRPIAAASIVAKVTRDRIMADHAVTWPGYGWERNRGYPTPEHIRALDTHGLTPLHRRSFAPVRSRLPAEMSQPSLSSHTATA